ncbi:MAG: alpha-amylase, partial [Sphingomonadaceae bacterium]
MASTSAQSAFNARLFEKRFKRSETDLFGMLERLYGARDDYGAFCAALKDELAAAWDARPDDLKWCDLERDLEPDWFQRPDMAGYVFYLDRFAGDLKGAASKIDYLQDLGITYVH